jgi:hypothetical protein
MAVTEETLSHSADCVGRANSTATVAMVRRVTATPTRTLR